jgi:hypothetical protein
MKPKKSGELIQSCVVAKKLGRKFAGVEQEQEYCQIAAKRINRAESDNAIQGYHDGCFWERNSLADQKLNQDFRSIRSP